MHDACHKRDAELSLSNMIFSLRETENAKRQATTAVVCRNSIKKFPFFKLPLFFEKSADTSRPNLSENQSGFFDLEQKANFSLRFAIKARLNFYFNSILVIMGCMHDSLFLYHKPTACSSRTASPSLK